MKWALTAVGAAALICGCSRNIENKEAVRQGVVEYLDRISSKTGLDMNRMNVDVSNVSFKKNEATASVAIKAKGSDSAGMSTTYVLERQGEKWIVKGRKESGVNPHGAQGMPQGTPESGALPPGHPPTDTKPQDNK